MLPRAARLTRRSDFSRTVRRGRRAARGCVVVHLLQADRGAGTRVGFVVSRTVGGSVVRHRVQRKLRHLVRDRRGLLPPDSRIVVRAKPCSAAASSAALGRDLDAALERLSRMESRR